MSKVLLSLAIAVGASLVLGLLFAATEVAMETTADAFFCDGQVVGESSNRGHGQRSGYTVYCQTPDGTRDVGVQSLFVAAIFTSLGSLVVFGSTIFIGLQVIFRLSKR